MMKADDTRMMAAQDALARKQEGVGHEHYLVAMCQQNSALNDVGVTVERIQATYDMPPHIPPSGDDAVVGRQTYGLPDGDRLRYFAHGLALGWGDEEVTAAHYVIAFLYAFDERGRSCARLGTSVADLFAAHRRRGDRVPLDMPPAYDGMM
jgi:Clp amino terminal domain, pathogenicity island component